MLCNRYVVYTTWLLYTGSGYCRQVNHPTLSNDTDQLGLPPLQVGKLAFLAGIKARHIHPCETVGNTVIPQSSWFISKTVVLLHHHHHFICPPKNKVVL